MRSPEPALGWQPIRCPAAERVLRQLVEALLFEKLVPATRPGPKANCWRRIRFAAGDDRYECMGKSGAFGRIRVRPGSIECLGAADASPEALVPALVMALEGDSCSRARLLSELQQTVELCRWNLRRLGLRPPRRDLDYAALESAIDEGHPYHPCFKARTGFTLVDHRRFGPEAGNSFPLTWVAVRRSALCMALPVPDSQFWSDELGPEQHFRLRASFNRAGIFWNEFSPVPVHPWQWQTLKAGPLAAALAGGEVRPLGTFGDRYRATQSVRTLLNVSRPEAAALKLPLAMVNTSSLRTLAPHSVGTAPAVSAWLQEIVRSDAFFRQAPLVVLAEYAGLLYRPGNDALSLAGHLGALWRENLSVYLKPGQEAAPFNALMLTESDGRPFVDRWLSRYGLEAWLAQLIRTAVLPVWHLLVHHGIAVEAHAQNMTLIHRDGWPEGIALRDFHESVEFVESYLAEPDRRPDFARIDPVYRDAPSDRYFWMSSVEALRELVMDTLFVFNLSELSFLLESVYGFSEDRFWARVAHCLDRYASSGHTSPRRIARLGHQAPMLLSESLLAQKLQADPEQVCQHWIPNPLYRQPVLKHLPKRSPLGHQSGSAHDAIRE